MGGTSGQLEALLDGSVVEWSDMQTKAPAVRAEDRMDSYMLRRATAAVEGAQLPEAKALYEWNYSKQLLRIQAELGTTIVFVTHDIDEAVKMGDRIAVFNAGSGVEQFDTPERLLTEPASDFVADFVGAGATIKRLTLTRVADVGRHHGSL